MGFPLTSFQDTLISIRYTCEGEKAGAKPEEAGHPSKRPLRSLQVDPIQQVSIGFFDPGNLHAIIFT